MASSSDECSPVPPKLSFGVDSILSKDHDDDEEDARRGLLKAERVFEIKTSEMMSTSSGTSAFAPWLAAAHAAGPFGQKQGEVIHLKLLCTKLGTLLQ